MPQMRMLAHFGWSGSGARECMCTTTRRSNVQQVPRLLHQPHEALLALRLRLRALAERARPARLPPQRRPAVVSLVLVAVAPPRHARRGRAGHARAEARPLRGDDAEAKGGLVRR